MFISYCVNFTTYIYLCIFYRQWTAFLSAASTAGYVYLYSFYYFFFKTKYVFFFFRAHYLCYKLSKSRWGLTWRTSKNVSVGGEGLIGFCELFKCPRPFWCFFFYRFNKAFVYRLFYRMYGLFQTTFYFGYMALFSAGLGIMCGKCYGTLMLLLTKNDGHCNWLVNWAPSKKVLQYNIYLYNVQ